jgi:hypothetical protein
LRGRHCPLAIADVLDDYNIHILRTVAAKHRGQPGTAAPARPRRGVAVYRPVLGDEPQIINDSSCWSASCIR